MNQHTIIGNLVHDPETGTTQAGVNWCRFKVAVRKKYKKEGGPVKTARHLLVTDKHLGAICEAAMKSECILCMREGGEINRCELREALLEAAPPTNLDESDGLFRKCEYRDAAGALVQGNDVTI